MLTLIKKVLEDAVVNGRYYVASANAIAEMEKRPMNVTSVTSKIAVMRSRIVEVIHLERRQLSGLTAAMRRRESRLLNILMNLERIETCVSAPGFQDAINTQELRL